VSVRVPLPALPERLLVLVDAVSAPGVATDVSREVVLSVVSFSCPEPQAVVRVIAIAIKILSAFIMYRLGSYYLLQRVVKIVSNSKNLVGYLLSAHGVAKPVQVSNCGLINLSIVKNLF
jgi:hypothetical protein